MHKVWTRSHSMSPDKYNYVKDRIGKSVMQSSTRVGRRIWWFMLLNTGERSRRMRTNERALLARRDSPREGSSQWSVQSWSKLNCERQDSWLEMAHSRVLEKERKKICSLYLQMSVVSTSEPSSILWTHRKQHQDTEFTRSTSRNSLLLGVSSTLDVCWTHPPSSSSE